MLIQVFENVFVKAANDHDGMATSVHGTPVVVKTVSACFVNAREALLNVSGLTRKPTGITHRFDDDAAFLGDKDGRISAAAADILTGAGNWNMWNRRQWTRLGPQPYG